MKKIYNKKEKGIASTVGTIFALMIFTALLGMFMTQVVPVTMKENEAQHDTDVLSQFAQLRSTVDILSLTKNTNYTAYTPIKLGADGIPFFASPTYGELSLYPSQANSNYQMDMQFQDKFGNVIYRNASGSLQFIAPNKYYVPEIFEFANGALMRYNFQTNTSVFPINPNVRFEQVSLGYAINCTNNRKVTVSNDNSLDVTGPITVEAWVYIHSIKSQSFVSKSGNYVLWMTSTGKIRFADSTGHGVTTNASLPNTYLNRWIFIAGVFDGKEGDTITTSNTHIYINGVEAPSTPNGNWAPSDLTKDLLIGSGLDGMIDEVRILNRALDAGDIENDYLAGFHFPNRYGIVGWYHFDTGSGTTAVDSSQYHNNGTLSNANMWVPITGVNVYSTLQNIFGNPDSITGTETRSISISLEGVSTATYDIGGTLNITVVDSYSYSKSLTLNFTKYWISYLMDSLNATGLKEGVDYTVTGNVIHIAYVENANINMIYLSMGIER